jgi:ABC-2 family transporter protein
MAWVTWRQHRAQLFATAAFVAALAALALGTSWPIRDAYHRQALSSCLPPSARPGCEVIVSHFRSEFAGLAHLARYLMILPALALLIGVPLLAREFEHGTFRLAWTQGISRRRWLVSKTALLAVGLAAAAAALAVVAMWWRQPFDQFSGRMNPSQFDVEGTVVPAYALYALAVGLLAAGLLRRTLPATFLAVGVFVLTRIGVEKLLRPHYLPPLHRVATDSTMTAHARDWIFADTVVDGGGRAITTAREDLAVVHAQHAGIDAQQYLTSLGWRRLITFQPDSRFWTFQAIETGIFLVLAGLAVAAAVVFVSRRPA